MLNEFDINYFKKYLSFYLHTSLEEQALIVQSAITRHFEMGTELFNGTDECSGLILVKEGQMRAYYSADDGRQITLYRLLEGDVCILSASCVLKNITFDVSFEFEKDSDLYIIPTQIWSQLTHTNRMAQSFAMELMASRFSEVMWVMEQLVFKGIGERLASYLIEETTLRESNHLAITHEHIAKNLSTAREVISRTLKHFQSDGIIEISRGNITVLDFKKLHHFLT